MSQQVTEVTIEGGVESDQVASSKTAGGKMVGSEVAAPKLAAYIIKPSTQNFAHAVLLCHGVPSKQRPGVPNLTYQGLAKRITNTLGWTVLAVSLRGCGDSEGDFSLEGWIGDVCRSVEYLSAQGYQKIWLVGSTTGGSLALLAASREERVSGVAALAPRADFDDWAHDARRFVEHCRSLGVISTPGFPASLQSWAKELRENRPLDAVSQLGERPLLIIHGMEDRQVPVEEAQDLAMRNPKAELRLIQGANHRIRHDPRAIAVLQGWLEKL